MRSTNSNNKINTSTENMYAQLGISDEVYDYCKKMGADWNKLFQRTLCTGIPGILDDGVCCNLCSIGGRYPVFK